MKYFFLLFFISLKSHAFFQENLACGKNFGKWDWIKRECVYDKNPIKKVGCRKYDDFGFKKKEDSLKRIKKIALACAIEKCYQRDGMPIKKEASKVDWVRCKKDKYNNWYCRNTVYVDCKVR